MKKFKNAIALLIAATMIFSMTGCGKNKNDSTAESSGASATETNNSASNETAERQTIEDLYGNQLPAYLNRQYSFEGQTIPLAESNYYFIQAFSDLSSYAQYYGLPQTSEGFIDLSAEYSSSNPDEPDMQTWGDFLIEYAETQLLNTNVMCKLAEEKGLALTDDDKASIESVFDNIQTNVLDVDTTGLTMEEYLKINFGDYCTREDLTNVMVRMKLAEYYMADYADNYEFKDEDIMIPNIRYALFYLDPEASDEEVEKQKAECEKMLAASTSLDVFEVEGQLGQANGAVYEYGSEIGVPKGQMVPEFEEWAYDESREVGDIDMIRTEAYGYFIVGYLGLTEVSQETKDSLAVSALNQEMQEKIEDGTYSLSYEGTTARDPENTTPAPTYEHITVVRDGVEYKGGTTAKPQKDYSNTIIIAVLAVAAGAIGGAGIYGSIVNRKEKKARKEKN